MPVLMVPTCIHWFAWDQRSSWKIVELSLHGVQTCTSTAANIWEGKSKDKNIQGQQEKWVVVSKGKSIWAQKLMIPTRSRPEGQGREQSTKQRYEYNANKKKLMCKLKSSHSAPSHPPFEPKKPRNFLSWVFWGGNILLLVSQEFA